MSTQVIKSDGSKVPFDAKKIIRAITRAARDAKLSPEEINNLVKEVTDNVIPAIESKDKILSSDIKNKIFSELDHLAPKVVVEWQKFAYSK